MFAQCNNTNCNKLATVITIAGELLCEECHKQKLELLARYRPQLETLSKEIAKL